ncbi:MAG: hypothetical protein OD816_000591 [Thermodesulfobacterium sp.]|uniref:Uncharacterized protein n=1 Tax=Candidatus Thermodesulfobacterium syntrophicum TaxID=3060442 RepID=A0AAE3P5X0_9BACT|nr:hypothetical protein [Candidatus Thermodesulfobacterium syntrophicum]
MSPLFTKKEILPGIELEELLKLSEKEIEKSLAGLKFQQVYDLVLSVPWEERAKFILYSPYPEGIVKNLPPQELFLTIKASSLDLAVELLSYAKGSQIQFMFDIDAWYKDRIKAERVASWIILLFNAGEDKVLEWLRFADWDFLVAVFQKFVRVYKKPDDVELIEAMDFLPPYTLDDFYFVDFKVNSLEFYFRRMIEIIREEMQDVYFAFMESVIWEIPAEVEERAYRWRNGRLADEGIPDYFEALDIYSYIHPKRLKKIDPRYLPIDEEYQPSINIAIYKGSEELFIFKVFDILKDTYQIERIKRELAWIANKVIIVDNVVIDDIEQIKKSLEKVWGALNIGLEYVSMENLEIAKKVLEEHFLEDIFRVSQTVLKELRKTALSYIKNRDFDPSILNYLDQPYQGFLKGILVKKINEIKLFQPDKIGTEEEYTFFRRMEEIRTVRRCIEEIGYIAPLIEKMFGSPFSWINEVNKPGRNFDAPFITWSSLILTALSQWIYKKEFVFEALPRSAWKEVIRELMQEKGDICCMREELKKTLSENFEKFARNKWYLEKDLLNSFLSFVIKKFENEFKYIHLKEPPDPKYQTLILIDLTS